MTTPAHPTKPTAPRATNSIHFACTTHEFTTSNCLAEGTVPVCAACDRRRTFLRAAIDHKVTSFLATWRHHREDEFVLPWVLIEAQELITLFQTNAHALGWTEAELSRLDEFSTNPRTARGRETIPLIASFLCRRWVHTGSSARMAAVTP